MCGLYLVPRPVAVQRDGGWMAQVDLRASAGKDARIVMARVDATGAQALTAVSLHLVGPALHINGLPAGADVVTVKVGVDATGKYVTTNETYTVMASCAAPSTAGVKRPCRCT